MAAELTISAIGAAGDGIARLDGRTLYVPGALPGERVLAEIAGERATPITWLTESPDRVAPPCPHAGRCGGCALQHWAPAPYAAWKRALLVQALDRAGFAAAAVAPLARTLPAARRRADLALRRDGKGITLGLHARGRAGIADLGTCCVLDPRLVALFAPLRALLQGLPALRRMGSAVLNLLDTGPDLLLRTDAPLDAAGRAKLAGFAGAQGLPRIAWARGDDAPETAAQLGPVGIAFAGVTVVPPPGAFLQASAAGEAAIVAAVLAGLPARLPARAMIADLYAGLGTLSLPLAGRARVQAFESEPGAVAALARAAQGGGARVQAVRRDLARQPLGAKEAAGYAAVVLDPPFAGAAEQMALLARARVPRIIHVSCNPVALARDAAPLAAAGYRLVSAVPVDQFLWSPHLEAVTVFARGEDPAGPVRRPLRGPG
jgi:23S rRNA (uracil1939-C5)-methyltransferase